MNQCMHSGLVRSLAVVGHVVGRNIGIREHQKKNIPMTAEEIVSEIEKLDPTTRNQLNQYCAKQIDDLRWVLRTHPDQEMVKSSCLHFLGDETQEWYNNRKKE